MVECLHRTLRINPVWPKYMKKYNLKIMILVGFLAFFIFGGVFLFFSVGNILSPQDKLEKADVIIAVSGGETFSRTLEAVNLYNDNWAPKLLFSGAAKSGEVSNAEAMRRYAINKGVPAEDIIIEEKSTSTYQNALFSRNIIEENDWKSVILVTSPYHQRRAYMNFRYALDKNIKIINHSSDDYSWEASGWFSSNKNISTTLGEVSKIIYLFLTKDYSREAS